MEHQKSGRSTPKLDFRPIHPFPARMAPSLVWEELRQLRKGDLKVLDPMVGSGTTIVAARSLGHYGLGFDTDPLAVLISKAWCSDVDVETVRRAAERVLRMARPKVLRLTLTDAYPSGASDSTKAFVRYWFDAVARKHLAALSHAIRAEEDVHIQDLLWCAFSRLIIVKQSGASLAMDVAHSRPHKVYTKAPLKPLDGFERAIRTVLVNAPFSGATASNARRPAARVQLGDARSLPVEDGAIDVVVTSPPYLNAIDYLRGHKFSLVWMGHDIDKLREVRASNVGTEVSANANGSTPVLQRALKRVKAGELPPRESNMLTRYLADMHAVLAETARVLKNSGRAILVLGNSSLRGVFLANSRAIETLAGDVGLQLLRQRTRPLPSNRRYLPPPGSPGTGKQLEGRMREEVIMTFTRS
jgi:DNA modification methylase